MTDPIRTVPPKDAIASVDGEDLPGPEPELPAGAEVTELAEPAVRPVAEEPIAKVLDIE